MQNENDRPIYVSRRTWRSFWLQYRVYPDRIEIPSILGLKVIAAEDLLECETRPALVAWDLFRGKGLAYCWALKLDLADLAPHVAVRRRHGWFKRLRFTPDDPERFVEACRQITG